MLTRRAVVHDDVVLDKRTNILYARYVPNGIRLRGNQELLDAVGSVTASNKNIVVYGSLQEAIQANPSAVKDSSLERFRHVQ